LCLSATADTWACRDSLLIEAPLIVKDERLSTASIAPGRIELHLKKAFTHRARAQATKGIFPVGLAFDAGIAD
jgi:hypothetical protein